MKRIGIMLAALTAVLAAAAQTVLPCDSLLRRQAARVLMVGFRGDSVTEQSDAARYVRDLHVGAIVLFDIDLTGTATVGSRNVTSKGRLARMTAQLRRWADEPLLIALDQEGGRVVRLKPQYGYLPLPSAKHLGQLDSEDTTRFYGRRMASQLAESGVNVNLAPVVDLDNPACPALGKLDRCYAGDPDAVTRQAAWLIDEHHRQGVRCTLKHFPGHGNAAGDSHWGFVDVTDTWQPDELEPFRQLIARHQADLVMTAHIINRRIDPDYPATLSHKTIDGLLRRQLGFDGVVVTDDLYMDAILARYSIEEALVLTLNAGADLICVGNNINTGFEADRPFRLVEMIVQAVKDGRIAPSRLAEASNRVQHLAQGETQHE
ncbi:MAG: glycoside hydrolase family 3 protein [Muribaculaceae bacterium]|nr:glycoside hydrolase family 3 protein [Muribaculaceae bacterium]